MAPIEPAHLVGTGGAIGALLRYAVVLALPDDAFPTGTMTVNVLGSFVLGLVAFAGAGEDVAFLVGVGVCGAFTTFSSFSFETVRLVETGRWVEAAIYAGGTLAAALGAVGVARIVVAVTGLGGA